jgi:hypothetical protein
MSRWPSSETRQAELLPPHATLQRKVTGTYLGPISPSSRTKAYTITESVDKDEQDTHIVGCVIDVVRIHNR